MSLTSYVILESGSFYVYVYAHLIFYFRKLLFFPEWLTMKISFLCFHEPMTCSLINISLNSIQLSVALSSNFVPKIYCLVYFYIEVTKCYP